MAKAIKLIINKISAHKCTLYIKILIDVGSQDLIYPNLKNFYQAAKKKTREELFSELIHLQFKTFPNGNPQFTDNYLAILNCIRYQIDKHPNFNIKQAMINHFSQIIKSGFISGAVNYDLIKLIQEVAKKNTVMMNYHPSELEKRYEYIKSEYSDVKNQLEEIRKIFSDTDCIVEFFNFINFIYEAKKSKEEQDKERELARKKAEEELLSEENHLQQKEKHKPKKKKKGSITKKESEISSKKLEDEVSSIQESNEIESSLPTTSSELDLPQTSNSDLKGDKNKELCEELSNLIHLKFPDKRSKKFAEEVRQTISKEEKNQQLYKTIIDFYLSRVRCNIKGYNAKYSRHIADTKNKFGTSDFNYQINKFITQNLSDIALTIRSINSDLQEIFATLDRITPLIYESQHDQQQSETWLEITGGDTLLVFKEFLAYLEDLGEWRNNKLEYVTKNKIRRKSAKAKPERENEKRAIEDIELCVKLLASFYDKYTSKRNNDPLQPSNQAVEEMKYNISEESTNYDAETTIATFSQEEFPPLQSPNTLGSVNSNAKHQEWCSLRLTEVEIEKLSTELRKCSC